jgi:hypothetical protein
MKKEIQGNVIVEVGKGQVANAVHNLVKDLLPSAEEVTKKVDTAIQQESGRLRAAVDEKIESYEAFGGYMRRRLEGRFDSDMRKYIKNAVRERVTEIIREEIELTIAQMVESGMEVKIGWRNTTTMKVIDKGRGS